MNDYSRNCVFTEENNESVSSVCLTECLDPLENLGVVIEPKVYRLNNVVFAEPLKITKTTSKDDLAQDSIVEDVDTIDIENVTVIRRKGKRNKYNINMKQSDLTCPQQQCKKSFPTITLLKAHIRKVHCSEKDFVCEQCGTGFTAQYLLNRHYLVHSKEKTQCPVCCKMLSRRTNLRVHLRSHADTRPHECPVCHKRFLRRSTMNVHVSFVHKNHDRYDF